MGSPATVNLDSLRRALADRPGASVADLAKASGLARSTTGKALAGLEATGAARREPGARAGSRRTPDRWYLAQAPAVASRSDPPRPGTASEGSARLGRGQLQDLVVQALGAAGEASPSALARSLGRSAGAVSNALERLQEAGLVARTSEHPRRYRLHGEVGGARPA